jgi:hypothetical protein
MFSQRRFKNDEERNAEKIHAIQFGTELAQKLDPLICDLLNDFVGSLDYPETAQSSLQEVTDVDLQADVPNGTGFGHWWLMDDSPNSNKFNLHLRYYSGNVFYLSAESLHIPDDQLFFLCGNLHQLTRLMVILQYNRTEIKTWPGEWPDRL